MSDPTEQEAASQGDKGTSEATSPETKGTEQPDELSLARKRQAGAEKAREQAVTENTDLKKRVAQYEAANQTEAQKDMTELARQTARADEAEKSRDNAQALADAKYLDKVYPNARKELPEVTDEVRLAKFEALLAEDVPVDPGTPERHNENKTSNTVAKKPATKADLEAQVLSMNLPEDW